MSALKDQITDAMKDAMRAKDKPRLGTIRLILADMKRIEVDERIELDDDRIIIVMDKMLKQRRDSISQFEAADRQELADIEKAEITVIQSFMPAALSEEEIVQLVSDSAMTSLIRGNKRCAWSREASSGTTPPYSACRST